MFISLITQSLVILGEKNYSLVLDFPLNEQISKENVLQFAYGFYGTITVSIGLSHQQFHSYRIRTYFHLLSISCFNSC